MDQFEYSGEELSLFLHAHNWKRYWSRHIQPFMGRTVLDVGAGIGSTAKIMKDGDFDRWVCLEPDPGMAKAIQDEVASGNLPEYVEVLSTNSRMIDQREVFDTILYIDVLEHIEDDAEELAHIGQFLKASGKIIILSPAHNYLYTPFDKKIGHFRRYNKGMLRSVVPSGFRTIKCSYLDSVGMLASLGNKMVLKSANPTQGQIQTWDRLMVPVSRLVDPLIGHNLGKSIICVIEKDASSAQTAER